MLKYDSTYGIFNHKVNSKENSILIDDKFGSIKYDLVYLEEEGKYTKVYNAEVINGTDIIKKDN